MNASSTLVNLSQAQSEKRLDIEDLVNEASAVIGPVWPLKNAIACNPLLALENKPFWDAIDQAESLLFSSKVFLEIDEKTINQHFLKSIQAFLDEGQSTWKMPDRHLGFYRCWRRLALYDGLLVRTDNDRKILASFPEDPKEAIELGIRRFGIQKKQSVEYLAFQLAQLPGWAGFVKWHTEWQSKPSNTPIDLIEFLAVRIVIASLVEQKMPNTNKTQKRGVPARYWKRDQIELQEKRYARELVGNISKQTKKPSFSFRKENPMGQLVFCIDVRSESFRKQLEVQGNWETFGFAGFFGIPVALKNQDASETYPSCPVLLKPVHEVLESSEQSIYSKMSSKIKAIFLRCYQGLKYQFGTPFALAEAIGPWSGIWMTFKSLAPKTAHKLNRIPSKEHDHQFCCLEESISLKEQIAYAKSALLMIGLNKNFAPIVVFCGHGSTVQNNPHASSLNCGACGGNRGGPNARLIASILNSPKVRLELKKQGICIPEETLFLAGEHDTATDELTLFYNERDINRHSTIIEQLKLDLKRAQRANTSDRMIYFGSNTGFGEAIARSTAWSETRPEWGLARNAAFVVGPRTLTENLDLNNRCFLHSYDWTLDAQGKYLETILTAPMVVAQWINSQYFFSTFHPTVFGSGSKITQNVVGKFGVMQGNVSDLMHGLPLQSIYSNDDTPYHDPMRLLTVVFAPRAQMDSIVKRQPILQKLFFNNWVRLVAIDPTDLKSYQLEAEEVWNEIRGFEAKNV